MADQFSDPTHQGADPDLSVDEADMLRGILATVHEGVLATDPAGSIEWANESAVRIFGHPLDDLVGRPLTALIAPRHHDDLVAARQRASAGEPVARLLLEGLRRDTSTFEMAVTPAVRRDARGRVLGISVVVADLTDENRLRQELTEALARADARFDQSDTPQALLDLETRFVAVNDAGCRLLGLTRDDLIGLAATDLIGPDEVAQVADRIDDLRAGRGRSLSTELTAHLQGRDVPLLVDASVVHDDDQHPREIVVSARDLTDVHEARRRLAAQGHFFEALYRRATDVVVVTDRDNRLTYVSPSYEGVFGRPGSEVLGKVGFEFVHPDDVAASRDYLEQLLAEPGASARRLSRARVPDGDWRWFDTITTNCLDDPDIGGMVSNLRDVTSEIEAQGQLRESEARYRAIVETAQEGIVALAPDGSVLFANDKLAQLTGVPLEEIYQRGLGGLLDPVERERMHARLDVREHVGPEQYEVTYRHPDGTHRTWSVAASPLFHDDGTAMGALGMVSDVTTSRAAEAELRHRALHDSLTGLPNRALLVDRLSMASARLARGTSHGAAVLFLDLDHFKLVNDRHGHEAGDRLLGQVAIRLRGAVRDADTVARIGGDEFAIVCENADETQVMAVASRVHRALAVSFDLDGEPLHVAASIGVALAPPNPVGDLLRFADAAMYDAKQAGRSRVSVYDGAADGVLHRRLEIVNALKEALEGDALTLGYQPLVDLATDDLVGLEALLRWQHPTLGDVPPLELVRAAESAGLAFELDRRVLLTAAHELVRLRRCGDVGDEVAVWVNISAHSTHRPLDDLIDEVVARSGLPARCLGLEITERALMDNAQHSARMLTWVAERGVRVAVDDVGTGYTSLADLHRLPLSVLKIDRSFVGDLTTVEEALAVARSVVGLAATTGMTTVAEGVETEDQVRVLRELGCRVGQGFLWGPAVPGDEVAASLARWRH